ncbi:MAG: thioredoxin family protein [Armatimonadetes bacterium]|nr:thioredoxin family protein [Armatimonadota bacterium]MDE2206931.1 thioredoxin family protein [Armatimonadota bacterium]
MRTLFGVMALGLVGSLSIAASATAPAKAKDVLKSAYKEASSDHKNVLVIFHASWCVWCHRLEDALKDPAFGDPIRQNFVIATIDVLEQPKQKAQLENPGGAGLLTKWKGDKSGIPFYVMLDPHGKVLGDSNVMPKDQNIGYPSAPEEVTAFVQLLQKTAPHLTTSQAKQLSDWLTAHKPAGGA